MENFHGLMDLVMHQGEDIPHERTGIMCRSLVGAQLKFDLRAGFPGITTKKLAFNGVKGELLGFFRGCTSAAEFRDLGCQVWNQNANETADWLANPWREDRVDYLGPIYGKQWTDWLAYREVSLGKPELVQHTLQGGFEQVATTPDGATGIFRKSINQLEEALRKLLTHPTDRRIIISGWNVGELDMMALPPCHMDYRFVAMPAGAGRAATLHVVMTIRSWDLFLGGPFNVASTSLFLAIMARLAGYEPGTVTIQVTNAHIYENHFDQVREQLSRQHLPAPTLVLSDRIRRVSLDEVAGAFARIAPDDIALQGYQSHAAIKAPMAA